MCVAEYDAIMCHMYSRLLMRDEQTGTQAVRSCVGLIMVSILHFSVGRRVTWGGDPSHKCDIGYKDCHNANGRDAHLVGLL